MPPSSKRPSAGKRLWKHVRWWLYRGHRWSGIALCVLFAVWFVSGVVMMYVSFPSFRAEERVATAPAIAWEKVRIGPQTALERLGLDAFPDEMRLGMTGSEPVYRIAVGGARRAVSATTGREVTGIDAAQAARIASAFSRARAGRVDLVARDQWVETRAYAKIAPFWRVRMDDGTDIYVTRATGEIVQNPDRPERAWNWLGAVPHWIYFEALRAHQEPWRQTVIWTSGIGTVMAMRRRSRCATRAARTHALPSAQPLAGW